ncbi:hypothetical protein Hypma_004092 [Hypsizygus marmoreus]|uniref:Uncharacterized protein n=1 Tax=Hypsizygus marmoreus TaxID=39966 RepID=A0A369JYP3_HYPMA|nr:hypothetical protein Hypma_004092 [Hypsizygus marmoreus]
MLKFSIFPGASKSVNGADDWKNKSRVMVFNLSMIDSVAWCKYHVTDNVRIDPQSPGLPPDDLDETTLKVLHIPIFQSIVTAHGHLIMRSGYHCTRQELERAHQLRGRRYSPLPVDLVHYRKPDQRRSKNSFTRSYHLSIDVILVRPPTPLHASAALPL